MSGTPAAGVVGVGVDAVEVARLRRVLARRPGVARRVFTDAERAYAARFRDPVPRLAARFAAKEALMKSLGVGLGAFAFHDVEVGRRPSGEPVLAVTGGAAEVAARRGATDLLVSLTHTESVSLAVVVAQAPPPAG